MPSNTIKIKINTHVDTLFVTKILNIKIFELFYTKKKLLIKKEFLKEF